MAVFVLPLPLAASAASTLIMSFLTFKLRSLGPPRRGGHDFMSRSIINPFPSDYLSLSLISSFLLARFLLGLYAKIAAKKLVSESGTIQWRLTTGIFFADSFIVLLFPRVWNEAGKIDVLGTGNSSRLDIQDTTGCGMKRNRGEARRKPCLVFISLKTSGFFSNRVSLNGFRTLEHLCDNMWRAEASARFIHLFLKFIKIHV